MSLFRRTKPGMVRVKQKEYIRLLQQEVKALRMEAEVVELERETAGIEAAAALLHIRNARPHIPARVLESVLVDVPLTADGELHVPALMALAENEIWRDREVVLQGVIASTRGDRA